MLCGLILRARRALSGIVMLRATSATESSRRRGWLLWGERIVRRVDGGQIGGLWIDLCRVVVGLGWRRLQW